MFAEEKPALVPPPIEPFRHYQFGDRRVNLDGCVEVDAAYHSAPPGWIGRGVKAQWDDRHVRVLDPRTGQLLREHLQQQRGGYRIPEEDRPAHTPRTTQQVLARCARIGSHIGALAEHMYRQDGVAVIGRIQALLSLARKHGAALTDDACAADLEIGVPANPYRFVRRWLERRSQLTLRRVDPISANFPSTATSLTTRVRRTIPNESHRTRTRAASAPPRRHGQRAGNPS
jgi:hypothetical protein